jgi:hypothetical protein
MHKLLITAALVAVLPGCGTYGWGSPGGPQQRGKLGVCVEEEAMNTISRNCGAPGYSWGGR